MRDKFNFENVLGLAATLLCVLGMLIIVGISGTEHLGFMGFNLFLIGASWHRIFKESELKKS